MWHKIGVIVVWLACLALGTLCALYVFSSAGGFSSNLDTYKIVGCSIMLSTFGFGCAVLARNIIFGDVGNFKEKKIEKPSISSYDEKWIKRGLPK